MKFKTLFGKLTVESPDGGEKFSLALYILESIIENEGTESITYGIQIDKLSSDEACVLESEKICDITPDKSEIEKFTRELFDGEVEPVSLREIVEDYVDSLAYLEAM